MNLTKKLSFPFLIIVIIVSFFHCASTSKFHNKMSLELESAYYQKTTDGFDVFIPIKTNPDNIILDSIYFRGKKAKLELSNQKLFIGHLKKVISKKQDIIMSSDPNAEYGNKVPKIPEKIPFKLNDDECIVSYIQADKINHFKVEGVIEK